MASKRQATGAVKVLREFVKKCQEARKHHPTVAKKKRKKAKRDPAWYGQKKRHAKAARKGAKKRKKSRRDPSWFGHRAAHRKAAKKGHSKRRGAKRRAGGKRRAGARDPMRYRRSSLGRRRGAAGPWYMTRDPE